VIGDVKWTIIKSIMVIFVQPLVKLLTELKFQKKTHEKFTTKYGGKVFYIISVKEGDKKKIYNTGVIEEIKQEIARLENE